jgi:hypothetical protein
LKDVIDVRFVLSYKLEHFFELLMERPISKFLYAGSFDLVDGQAFSIMVRMVIIETLFTYETGGLLAIFMYANIKDLFSLMTFDEAFRNHAPFGTKNFLQERLSLTLDY